MAQDDIFYKYSVNLPPSPLQSAIAGIEQGAGAVQKFLQNRNELARQQQQLQMGQLALQTEPQFLQAYLQQQQAHNQLTALQIRAMAQTMATNRMLQDKSMHGYVLSRLAELKGLPDEQMGQQYDVLKQHLINQGVSQDELPDKFGPQVKTAVDRAYNEINVPFEQKLQLEEAKGRSSIALAAAKQQMKEGIGGIGAPMPQLPGTAPIVPISPIAEKKFQEAEGKAYSKALTDAVDVSNKSQDLLDDANTFLTYAPKTIYGPLIGGFVSSFTTAGGLAIKAQNKMVGAMTQQFHWGRITDREMTIIRGMVPSLRMTREGAIKFANIVKASALRGIEYQKFMEATRQVGIRSASQAQTIWNRFMQEHPIISADGTIHTENISGWQSYLTPQALKISMEVPEAPREVK